MAATPGAITIRDGSVISTDASNYHRVQAGAVGTISYGTPVVTTLGSQYVVAGADGIPVVGTDWMVGIAADTSTDTVAADGSLHVIEMFPNVVYLCAPKLSTDIDTQAKYDALVGNRVVFDLTTGVWTVDAAAAHATTNGLVIMDSDIKKYPNKVAFCILQASSYLN